VSLSDLASLGSLVSGVAVPISLVFLYFQVRQVNLQVQQAEKNQQAAIRQERASRTVGINLAATDPAMADALRKGSFGTRDISMTELTQYVAHTRATFINCEDTFYQHKEGLLNDDAFASFVAGMRGSFAMPGFRAQWKLARSNYGPDFVELMNKLLAEAQVSPLAPDFLERWHSLVAADMSETTA